MNLSKIQNNYKSVIIIIGINHIWLADNYKHFLFPKCVIKKIFSISDPLHVGYIYDELTAQHKGSIRIMVNRIYEKSIRDKPIRDDSNDDNDKLNELMQGQQFVLNNMIKSFFNNAPSAKFIDAFHNITTSILRLVNVAPYITTKHKKELQFLFDMFNKKAEKTDHKNIKLLLVDPRLNNLSAKMEKTINKISDHFTEIDIFRAPCIPLDTEFRKNINDFKIYFQKKDLDHCVSDQAIEEYKKLFTVLKRQNRELIIFNYAHFANNENEFSMMPKWLLQILNGMNNLKIFLLFFKDPGNSLEFPIYQINKYDDIIKLYSIIYHIHRFGKDLSQLESVTIYKSIDHVKLNNLIGGKYKKYKIVTLTK